MYSDLLNISLNQGKQFNSYQSKIKQNVNKGLKNNDLISKRRNNRTIKEGFISENKEQIVMPSEDGYISVLQNQKLVNNEIKQSNQGELNELIQLQSKYQELVEQYNSIQKQVGDSNLDALNRTNSNKNPYLNKNIRFITILK